MISEVPFPSRSMILCALGSNKIFMCNSPSSHQSIKHLNKVIMFLIQAQYSQLFQVTIILQGPESPQIPGCPLLDTDQLFTAPPKFDTQN